MGAKNNNEQNELSTINSQPASPAARSELNKSQQHDEEVACLEKELQATQENWNKKLKVMKNVMFRAKREFEQVADSVLKVEQEKATLERDAEAAKLQALETARNCQEVLERTKATMVQVEYYERQINLHQAKQERVAKLQNEVKQAKIVMEQLEARWEQGEKDNEELLVRAKALRRERERIEASAKAKEKGARKNICRLTDNIEKLTEEITQLKLKASSSRIAALRRGSENLCTLCLSEEVSVVFIPCGHQVVCVTCNALHEKQEVECPACRSSISQRVTPRPASSSIF